MRKFIRLAKDDRGATAIEYGLIVALIFLGMMVGVTSFASSFNGMLNTVSTTLSETFADD